MSGSGFVRRYDRPTILLHWIVAAGVTFQWLGAHAIDWFPPGPWRVDARSVHIIGGVLLTFALIGRIIWRTRHGRHFRESRARLLHVAARLMHVALYAMLASVLLLGLLNCWVRGDSIFGWFHIPMFGDYGAAERHLLANRIVDLHSLTSTLLLILAGLHAMAGLIHHFYQRDDVLRRMVPWL